MIKSTYSFDDVSEKASSQSLSDMDRLSALRVLCDGGTQVLCVGCGGTAAE